MTRQEHIQATIAAIARGKEEIKSLFENMDIGDSVAYEYFGGTDEYQELCRKQRARQDMLARLMRKRNTCQFSE
jgi:hypothetical protein